MSMFISYINIFVHDEGKSMHNEIPGKEKVISRKGHLYFPPLHYLALHKEGTIEEIAKMARKKLFNYSEVNKPAG